MDTGQIIATYSHLNKISIISSIASDHKITQSLLVIYLFIILKKVRESLSMNWLSCSSSQQVRPFCHAKPFCQAKQKTKENRHSRVKTTQNSCWFDLKQRILRSCDNEHTEKESTESIPLLHRQLTLSDNITCTKYFLNSKW